MKRPARWTLVFVGLALCCLVLRLYQDSDAAPRSASQPFANAVEQRMEMITQLREIRMLLKEQNTLIKQQNELLHAVMPQRAAAPENKK